MQFVQFGSIFYNKIRKLNQTAKSMQFLDFWVLWFSSFWIGLTVNKRFDLVLNNPTKNYSCCHPTCQRKKG